MSVLDSEAQLKELLKSAFVEVLQERRDLLREIVEEALEDIALARAIEEGEATETSSREQILKVLDHES